MTEDVGIRVHLDVDDSEVDPALARVAAKSGKKLPSPKMDIDSAPATRALGQVDFKAKTLQGTLAKSTALKVDISAADKGIEDIKNHFIQQKKQIEAMAIQPKVTGGGSPVGNGSAFGKVSALSTVSKAGVVGGIVAVAVPAVIGGVAKLTGDAAQDKRLTDFTAKSLGGTAVVESAKRLSEETGFLATDFMQAALTGKTLQQTYGLQTDQVAKLVAVSADLAATSPYEDLQTVSGAMAGLKAAMGGNADAAARLGLTMDDTYMKNTALGGSLKGTWDAMDAATKAQAYYTEGLRQTQSILGKSKDETDISTQTRQLNTELGKLKTAVGAELIGPFAGFVKLVRELVDAIPDWVPKVAGVMGKAAAVGWKAEQIGVAIAPGGTQYIQTVPFLDPFPNLRRGGTFGERRAVPREGFGAGAGVDITVNVNNNNNSQIDASASAPSPY